MHVCLIDAQQQEVKPRQHLHVQCNNETHVVGPHTRYTKHTAAAAKKAVAHTYHRNACSLRSTYGAPGIPYQYHPEGDLCNTINIITTNVFPVVVTVAAKKTPFGLFRLSKFHLSLVLSNSCCHSFLTVLRGKRQQCTSSQLLNPSHLFVLGLQMLVSGGESTAINFKKS